MLQRNDKYFYAPYGAEKAGIGSKICDLELIINAALSLNRIPIIKESRDFLTSGKFTREMPIDWDKYIDLSKTRVLKVEAGKITELSDALQYIHERDFDFDSYAKNQVRHVDESQLHDKENERYSLICLKSIKNLKQQQKGMPIFYKNRGPVNMTSVARPSFLAIFSPSWEVNDLTDIVLNYFGTKQSDMELLSNILYPNVRTRDTNIYRCTPNLKYYGCMDVRYKKNSNVVSRLISKNIIKKKVNESIAKVRSNKIRHHKDLPLYIMSKAVDTDYFDFLKSMSTVYRYTDFKELRERFVAKKAIDHSLLYMVENNIMRHALVKVFPAKINRFAFEGRWGWVGKGI